VRRSASAGERLAAQNYGGFEVVLAIYFWIAFSSAIIGPARTGRPSTA
jgi:hypothetical protein